MLVKFLDANLGGFDYVNCGRVNKDSYFLSRFFNSLSKHREVLTVDRSVDS